MIFMLSSRTYAALSTAVKVSSSLGRWEYNPRLKNAKNAMMVILIDIMNKIWFEVLKIRNSWADCNENCAGMGWHGLPGLFDI
jgi:hypothetical protein